MKIECQIGGYIRANNCPKFMCIKNKYFLSKESKLRNIKNIIFESNGFYIYQQMLDKIYYHRCFVNIQRRNQQKMNCVYYIKQ